MCASVCVCVCERERERLSVYIHMRGAYDKFPDFFRMGISIDSTHIKL